MSERLHARYHGQSSPLFRLYFKTALLTLLTLGIYRFWAKTRIRKFIWAATSAGDDNFEYTGTGLEKFLGFLVAIVILAVYLGVMQSVLLFFGVFLFDEPETEAELYLQFLGSFITLFAVAPLLFFAQYRARRYRMARTRWRGLRFGMDKGAWGYAFRAIVHLFLTVVTFGLLLPRQTYYLEKYIVDRTWYGDGRFEQTGRWQEMYPAMKHLIIGALILLAGTLFVTLVPGLSVVAWIVGIVWAGIGLLHYRAQTFNYLAHHKVLDGEIRFEAGAQTGELVRIYAVGMLAIFGLGLAFSFVAGILAAGTGFGVASVMENGGTIAFPILMVVFAAVIYVGFFLAFGGLSLVMITQKFIGHFVQAVTVEQAEHLDVLKQRAADKGADAEGFADALDVGGAI